jgi:phosphatidylinositol glycan class B
MEVLPIGYSCFSILQNCIHFSFDGLYLPSLISLSLATLIDYVFYGVLTFVPWNFVKFNSVYGVSELYGTHPFHWYLAEAFPVMMLTFAPLAVLGVRSSGHMKSLSPIWLVITSTLAYSFNVHKEYRFPIF